MSNEQNQGRQLTAVQKRSQQVEIAKGKMIEAVEGEKAEIERFLVNFGISYEFFLAGLKVFLLQQAQKQPDFFLEVTPASFMEALFRIAMNGLIADGKEAAIAVYKGVATPMFMRDGFVKVMWRTGMIRSINDQTVTVKEYEAGRFDYREGDGGFIEHRMDLMRKDSDETAAAYCVIELVSGGVMREVVPKDELEKIAKMSKSPARGAWAHQMHRKAAIRRIMGKMPRDKGIVQLLQHDESNYDQALLSAGGAAQVDRKNLFSNRPVRAKRAAPAAIEQRQDELAPGFEPIRDDEGEMVPAETQGQEEVGATQTAELETGGAFILQAVITTKNGLQQFGPAEAEFWFGDLQQKMKHLEGEPLQAFWQKNRGYIEEAGRNGYGPYAMQLIELAHDLGLTQGGSDADD